MSKIIITLFLFCTHAMGSIVVNNSTGGLNAFFQIPLIDKLIGVGKTPDYMYGQSGGSTVTYLVSLCGTECAEDYAKSIKSREDVWDTHSRLKLILASFEWYDLQGLAHFGPLEKILNEYAAKYQTFQIPFSILVWDIINDKIVEVKSSDHTPKSIIPWILASMSVSGLIDPYKNQYADIGFQQMMAVEQLFNRPDFAEMQLYVFNAHAAKLPEFTPHGPASNLARGFQALYKALPQGDIFRIRQAMDYVGNKNLTVVNITKAHSFIEYTNENILDVLEQGRKLSEKIQ